MDQFKIRHFAGTVTYSSQGFLEKNLDSLDRRLAEVLFSCRHQLAKELFPDGITINTRVIYWRLNRGFFQKLYIVTFWT